MRQKSNAFLETEKLGKLMRKYAIPCVISLVVGALYNIVDQFFITNASYLGSYGNAANTVVFPLTVVALAISVMIGDGLLWSFPVADILTFVIALFFITKTCKELSEGSQLKQE